MKKALCSVAMLCAMHLCAKAQEVSAADSTLHERGIELGESVRNYDGFLLDMSLFRQAAPQLPRLSLKDFSLMPENTYKGIPTLDNTTIYTQQIVSNMFSSPRLYTLGNPFGNSELLQVKTTRLRNGMTLSTFGQYNMYGEKVNTTVLPWERNNFKAAFELRSANKQFGVKVEVQHGNLPPY